MSERNLYEEWWAHFLRFYEEAKEIYDKLVKTGNTELPWTLWIEDLRKEWFKEMRAKVKP